MSLILLFQYFLFRQEHLHLYVFHAIKVTRLDDDSSKFKPSKKGFRLQSAKSLTNLRKKKNVQEKSVSLSKIKKYVSFYQANQKCYVIK